MTYLEWADEYKQSCDSLQERMIELRKKCLTAPVEQLKELNLRISSLYGMYLDCMKTDKNLRKRKGVAF